MKKSSILAALLLMVAGLQTAWGQGFRVYKSDGTVTQYSLRTDSIVFYDGIGLEQDLGPYTPVNQCIVGTWYKSKYETVTFNEDGTTDYIAGCTYQFFPYQGNIIISNASGMPLSILKVYNLTSEQMLVGRPGSDDFSVWTSTLPTQYVTSITLSETSIRLRSDETKLLTATVEPADADNPAVTWASSDESVAEVNNSGRVMANAKGTCTITCSATDGSGVKAECTVTVYEDQSGSIGGREFVDLDLPSGTLWATCNVGASSPEEYGNLYAWGETEPKSNYNPSTYIFYDEEDGEYYWQRCTKYTYGGYYGGGVSDGRSELEPVDDAATANWGRNWQMPSREQCLELFNDNYTLMIKTSQNGVNGAKITSRSNGNSIFFPINPSWNFWYGWYWTRDLASQEPWAYFFKCSGYGGEVYSSIPNDDDDLGNRWVGRAVRPVRAQK